MTTRAQEFMNAVWEHRNNGAAVVVVVVVVGHPVTPGPPALTTSIKEPPGLFHRGEHLYFPV